ncbi:J domain-containing protein [Pseudomonas nunensis]|uniref:J domain-containing protein n=1 Tax=Pseudomonas nunensis TaxID=2961896 RepID=A0ABY5ERS3_9PSED|nr:J domain-containing protein [Pseudomonas nunensis]KPN91118.1 hypothetical protein AL066_12520 [Pseudomonas nunensis]MCL5227407.1 J domain-containing protein [Pseudomonas nunensis]UTO17390.1 J domain-containing protein [Pseudomonas nunensis]
MKWVDIDTGYKSQLDRIKCQNPYERLGVSETATLDEVKGAYRRKIKLYHPDRADAFMSSYVTEVIKLLNQAIEQIKKEKSHEQ